MEKAEYCKMFLFEQDYWWYKGLRLLITQKLASLQLDSNNVQVLDAGCGTGGNLILLKQLGYKKIFGFDIDAGAVSFCKQRGFDNIMKGNVNNIPFPKNKFDLIICIDVFECQEVNEKLAYQELIKTLKPGGYLLIIVAAFNFLLSEHDRAVHSVRRYNKQQVVKSFSNPLIKIKEINYNFFFTFPFIVFIRLFKNLLGINHRQPQSDLKSLPFLLNKILYFIICLELKISTRISFPVGTTLSIVIQKK